MATTQQPEVVQDRRTKALEEYRKKLVEHRELDANLKKRKFLHCSKIWSFQQVYLRGDFHTELFERKIEIQ
jgi:hypothetical protein